MNLNKLNKDQLINKIQDQENIITQKSYGNQILMSIKGLITGINGLILKFTLISLIIKYFKKYKFIRKVLLFCNWIILSLFGISVLDIYDTNLVSYSIEWIRSTHLYKILIELLDNNQIEKVDKTEVKINKIEIEENPSSILTTNNPISTRNETSIESNQNNIGQFNKPEIINEYKKYIILVSLLILAGLGWLFWDDVKPFLSSHKSKKPDSGSNNQNTTPDITDFREEYVEYFKEFKAIEVEEELYDLETIKSSGINVDYSEVQLDKWIESPTTPKAGPSKLPAKEVLMIPISKE